MKAAWRRLVSASTKTRRRKLITLALVICAIPAVAVFVVLVLWTIPIFGGRALLAPITRSARGLAYFHDEVRQVPWSMHVVKINRTRHDLALDAMMGNGTTLGMNTVSHQVNLLPPSLGRPVAAINGDLYNEHPDYPGDPEGMEIVRGELVSGPSTNRVCFWLDAAGNPHRDDVRSQFKITWPDGTSTPFGLNEARSATAAVLYTAAVGDTTRTHGGTELVLTRDGDGPWLPLQVGRTYRARVREFNTHGNSPLAADMLVLSLGPDLARQTPHLEPGAVLTLTTATSPALADIPMAIGGGPTLVQGGKAKDWDGVRLRHPRTAIGWNQEYLFLVVVDGRQLRLSAGMTFPELADYMVKLGCQEAMALDGGGSATCWAFGNVMNSPSQGRERPAANGLVVLQTTKRQN